MVVATNAASFFVGLLQVLPFYCLIDAVMKNCLLIHAAMQQLERANDACFFFKYTEKKTRIRFQPTRIYQKI